LAQIDFEGVPIPEQIERLKADFMSKRDGQPRRLG
jgi:hypothetical protein